MEVTTQTFSKDLDVAQSYLHRTGPLGFPATSGHVIYLMLLALARSYAVQRVPADLEASAQTPPEEPSPDLNATGVGYRNPQSTTPLSASAPPG